MVAKQYMDVTITRWMVLGALFIYAIWIPLTGLYCKIVIHAYLTTNLSMALLTIDSIFFGAIIVFMSILIYKSDVSKTHVISIVRLRNLSIGLSILLIANISTYFTSGLVQIVAIYYQLWTTPSFMLEFYNVFNKKILLAYNPKP